MRDYPKTFSKPTENVFPTFLMNNIMVSTPHRWPDIEKFRHRTGTGREAMLNILFVMREFGKRFLVVWKTFLSSPSFGILWVQDFKIKLCRGARLVGSIIFDISKFRPWKQTICTQFEQYQPVLTPPCVRAPNSTLLKLYKLSPL